MNLPWNGSVEKIETSDKPPSATLPSTCVWAFEFYSATYHLDILISQLQQIVDSLESQKPTPPKVIGRYSDPSSCVQLLKPAFPDSDSDSDSEERADSLNNGAAGSP